MRRDARGTDRSPAAKRPDHSPVHALIKQWIDRLSGKK
jgi:hypothetical protein